MIKKAFPRSSVYLNPASRVGEKGRREREREKKRESRREWRRTRMMEDRSKRGTVDLLILKRSRECKRSLVDLRMHDGISARRLVHSRETARRVSSFLVKRYCCISGHVMQLRNIQRCACIRIRVSRISMDSVDKCEYKDATHVVTFCENYALREVKYKTFPKEKYLGKVILYLFKLPIVELFGYFQRYF